MWWLKRFFEVCVSLSQLGRGLDMESELTDGFTCR